jgi:glutamate N-acetyltransferase/amino-acid N-acetyltransferase
LILKLLSNPNTTGNEKMENFVINGFTAAGVAAGLKKNGKKDLGIIYSTVTANVAGVFTRNRVKAAPVQLDRERIRSGIGRAIIVNSGNANCCTGEQGMKDAVAMAETVASSIGIPNEQVLVASTGVIGEPLPIEKIDTAVPQLVDKCTPQGLPDVAAAIMTTDTVPKIVSAAAELDGKPFKVAGVAKGSGMIRPNMATMLCFVVSDVQVASNILQEMLQMAADQSFNRITVDGDMSTNDTILLMANGTSGAEIKTPAHRDTFQNTLEEVLLQLAKLCVKDAEGATKLVEVEVKGALSSSDARRVADTVAHSNLVKTALFGEDANWGRILAAAGRSGVSIDPESVDIYFDEVQMVKQSVGCGKAVEAEATAVLKKTEFTISIDLNMGVGQASVFTCDFSIDYVRINADYRT